MHLIWFALIWSDLILYDLIWFNSIHCDKDKLSISLFVFFLLQLICCLCLPQWPTSLATLYDAWRRCQFLTNQWPINCLRYTHRQTDRESTYCQALLYEQGLQKTALHRKMDKKVNAKFKTIFLGVYTLFTKLKKGLECRYYISITYSLVVSNHCD